MKPTAIQQMIEAIEGEVRSSNIGGCPDFAWKTSLEILLEEARRLASEEANATPTAQCPECERLNARPIRVNNAGKCVECGKQVSSPIRTITIKSTVTPDFSKQDPQAEDDYKWAAKEIEQEAAHRPQPTAEAGLVEYGIREELEMLAVLITGGERLVKKDSVIELINRFHPAPQGDIVAEIKKWCRFKWKYNGTVHLQKEEGYRQAQCDAESIIAKHTPALKDGREGI